ncbi:MAG: spore germination protein [Clostridia bacterium]|nr:spore germination protein [Clostridia bacterium]
MKNISKSYDETIGILDDILRLDENFDLIGREMIIGGRQAKMYFVDAFCKDEILEKMLEYLTRLEEKQIKHVKNTRDFCSHFITYTETDVVSSIDEIVTSVLSGTLALIIEGFNQAIMIDARTYPVRSLDEPDNDKVLRGSHDGFCETIVFNTALIRRRIRDPKLTFSAMKVGKKSQTDIALCYLDNVVDKKLLESLKKRINKIEVNTLAMSQQSLVESLIPKQFYNPFPKVRYTERPDAAAACITEGNIIILIDNSPAAIIVKTSFFEFFQDSNDYYFSPIIGSYLRFVRMFVFSLSILLTPTWYLLVENPSYIPQWLSFIRIEEPSGVPVLAQIITIEVIIDMLKLASINTPQSLSSSFSVIGALILGEFAVGAGWFLPEVILYMAFVAIANFTQPSFELGYAMKFSRITVIILSAIFGLWGYIGGFLLMLILIATTETLAGKKYLYPLIPFDAKAIRSLLFRRSINKSKN